MNTFVQMALAVAVDNGVAWIDILGVGGPVMMGLGLIGGVAKWYSELRGKRTSTKLVNAQSDQTIVAATGELIKVVRSELNIMRKDIARERRYRAKLEAALTSHGLALPPEDAEVESEVAAS